MIPRSQIERWLQEDLGHHDISTDVPGETAGELIAREEGVVAGLKAAAAIYDYLDVPCQFHANDGDILDAEDVLLAVDGSARSILRAERVVVNLVGHLSGIATHTRRAVEAARTVSPNVRIAGTRKTTPGLRGLEKRAIAAGGGDTHRLDLSHMVMVKDNHIEELGLESAIDRVRERISFATKVEVEVESADEAVEAATAGADIVMLDNCSPEVVAEAVERLPLSELLLEASGGITIETIPEYADTGVDVISLGALTQAAPPVDLSFRIRSVP